MAAAANMSFFICVSLSAATRDSLRLKIRNPSNAVERQRTATSDTQIARTAHHFLGFVKIILSLLFCPSTRTHTAWAQSGQSTVEGTEGLSRIFWVCRGVDYSAKDGGEQDENEDENRRTRRGKISRGKIISCAATTLDVSPWAKRNSAAIIESKRMRSPVHAEMPTTGLR